MAVTINASTSAGAVTTADTSGVLQLQTGGTTALTVDASQNVGIGTASPGAKLVVTGSAAGAYGAIIYNTSATGQGLTVRGGSTSSHDAFNVQTYDGGASLLSVQAGGNVGIGTSSPAVKLDVSGTVGGSGSGFNPGTTAWVSAAFKGTGSYGGGISFVDGSNGATIYAGAANLIFGNGATSGGATERARIDSSGNLLVGTTTARGKITSTGSFSNGSTWSSTAAISVNGAFGGAVSFVDGAAGYAVYCADSGNDFYIQGSNSLSSALTGGVYLNDRATSWSSASDERLKTIIEPITDAVSKVCQLRTVIGRYNYEAEDKRHPFLIAQDVQAVLPEAVSVSDKQSEEQYLGVSYTDTIPLLVAAIKEQQTLITAMTARITALEGAPA